MNDIETNRDKVLRGEVVQVTFDRLMDMQRQSIAGEGIGPGYYHWHWVAAINELIALRATGAAASHEVRHLTDEDLNGPLNKEVYEATLPKAIALLHCNCAEGDDNAPDHAPECNLVRYPPRGCLAHSAEVKP